MKYEIYDAFHFKRQARNLARTLRKQGDTATVRKITRQSGGNRYKYLKYGVFIGKRRLRRLLK